MPTYLDWGERLYPRLPVPLQNTLISIRGAQFKRRRYGGDFQELLLSIERDATLGYEELRSLQIQRLRRTLRHAYETSPFHRERWTRMGVLPEQVSSINDLLAFPIMCKDDLRTNGARIRSTAFPRRSLVKVSSSGTSGKPLTVGFTLRDVRLRMAYLARMFRHSGVELFSRSARFSGRTIFPDADRNRVFWRLNAPANQLLMSSYHLRDDTMEEYVRALQGYRPTVIDGYPSAIFILARFMNLNGLSGAVTPRVISTTAETLEDYKRDEISRAFGGCPILNQYASSEGAPFITQDQFGDLVENIDSGVFELVRPGTTEPVEDGQPGELVLTSFVTHAYPLIRYRIGDVMVRKPGVLSRSWAMPVMHEILGRQEDIVHTPFRGYVGRLDPVFKKSPPTIIESQIVQVGPTAFELRVVPDVEAGFLIGQMDVVIDELRERLGPVDVRVELCDSLPRTASGKLRAVIGMGAAAS